MNPNSISNHLSQIQREGTDRGVMDSNTPENADSKAEFRKRSNDATNRKYRRRSPAGATSSSDDSPRRNRSSSPLPSRKDTADEKRRKNENGDLDRDYHRSGRSGESHKHYDWRSSRSYHRDDDHCRHDGRRDDFDRNYSKSNYRSGRDSRGCNNSDYSRVDKDYRSRNCSDDVDKYPRERSDPSGHRNRNKDAFDGRRQYDIEDRARDEDRVRNREDRGDRDEKTDHKHFVDRKSKYSPSYDGSSGQRDELSSQRDSSGHCPKESFSRDSKGLDNDKGSYKEQQNRVAEELADGTKTISSTDQDSITKKPKLFSMDSTGPGTNGASEQAGVQDSDIDAAMKAAELVNKNLIGTGYMSTDQKKKLLWGSKKTTATEESAHHWDTSTFGDRERQEKFNKLMGVKGDSKMEHKEDNPDVEKQRDQLQLELEKQYTAGLRRRDGRTVGLGL